VLNELAHNDPDGVASMDLAAQRIGLDTVVREADREEFEQLVGDLVDLTRDEIVVHREPAGTTFASVTRHHDGVVEALHHPGVAVDVLDLLR
jgi:hypothetical protein